jgi:hypothetical protein
MVKIGLANDVDSSKRLVTEQRCFELALLGRLELSPSVKAQGRAVRREQDFRGSRYCAASLISG